MKMDERITRIAPGTWAVEDGMVRFFILEGEDSALLLDSGVTAQDARAIAETVTSKPLLLLNTHADRDHIAGNGAFSAAMMHPAETSNYYHTAGAKGEVVPVWDGDVIDLGLRKLEIVHIPGHTPGSIAVLDPGAKMLFPGDSVQDGNIYMFGIQREIHAYLHSLKRLRTMEGRFDSIYPCHGTYPLRPDQIDRLIAGTAEVVAGRAAGEEAEMHGTTIRKYDIGCAVLLCDPEIDGE